MTAYEYVVLEITAKPLLEPVSPEIQAAVDKVWMRYDAWWLANIERLCLFGFAPPAPMTLNTADVQAHCFCESPPA